MEILPNMFNAPMFRYTSKGGVEYTVLFGKGDVLRQIDENTEYCPKDTSEGLYKVINRISISLEEDQAQPLVHEIMSNITDRLTEEGKKIAEEKKIFSLEKETRDLSYFDFQASGEFPSGIMYCLTIDQLQNCSPHMVEALDSNEMFEIIEEELHTLMKELEEIGEKKQEKERRWKVVDITTYPGYKK